MINDKIDSLREFTFALIVVTVTLTYIVAAFTLMACVVLSPVAFVVWLVIR